MFPVKGKPYIFRWVSEVSAFFKNRIGLRGFGLWRQLLCYPGDEAMAHIFWKLLIFLQLLEEDTVGIKGKHSISGQSVPFVNIYEECLTHRTGRTKLNFWISGELRAEN